MELLLNCPETDIAIFSGLKQKSWGQEEAAQEAEAERSGPNCLRSLIIDFYDVKLRSALILIPYL